MPLDPERDSIFWRRALAASAVGVVATMGAVFAVEQRRPWQETQRQLVELSLAEATPGIVEARVGQRVDRCPTCHLGVVTALAGPAPFRPHPEISWSHPPDEVACTSCHGGTGRALTKEAAHSLPGGAAEDPRHSSPYIEASCMTCHRPGEVAGTERLARGAERYLELGCGFCHGLESSYWAGLDFGPDLRLRRPQGLAQLERSVLSPTQNNPSSKMPSYAPRFSHHQTALEELLIYVIALALPRERHERDELAHMPCASCHGGAAGRATGRHEHSCPYLEDHGELACHNCHSAEIPQTERPCPVIEARRPACASCHLDEH